MSQEKTKILLEMTVQDRDANGLQQFGVISLLLNADPTAELAEKKSEASRSASVNSEAVQSPSKYYLQFSISVCEDISKGIRNVNCCCSNRRIEDSKRI